MNSSFLSHTWCPFLLCSFIFSGRRREMLIGAKLEWTEMFPLKDHKCDKLNNHLLPYVNQFIHKRRFSSEVDGNKGKIKTNCMSCFLGLIWEKLNHLLENNLLFDGHVNWKVFLKDFWLFISQPLTLYCWALKRFSYYPLFTIMFQKGKKKLITFNVV